MINAWNKSYCGLQCICDIRAGRYWELKENKTYSADLAHRTIIFWPVKQLGRSPIRQ